MSEWKMFGATCGKCRTSRDRSDNHVTTQSVTTLANSFPTNVLVNHVINFKDTHFGGFKTDITHDCVLVISVYIRTKATGVYSVRMQ